MKRKTIGILIGLGFFSALAMFSLSLWPAGSQTTNQKAEKNLLKESDLIQTALPQRRNFNATRAWFGQVKTLNKTYLKTLENGRIVSIKRHEGEAVKAGSLCGLGQTAPNPALSTLRYFRDEYDVHVIDRVCPQGKCPMNQEV